MRDRGEEFAGCEGSGRGGLEGRKMEAPECGEDCLDGAAEEGWKPGDQY